MKLNLDERLRAILDAISDVGTLADVGCDHGKVSVSALLEGRAERVIAVDISAMSLQKTVALATECGVTLKAIQSDGLTKVSDDIDLAVIAGLGGYEIIKIISESGEDRCDFLCVAHQDEWILRKFLSGKFEIIKDCVVKCGRKFYSLIYAKRSQNKTTYSEHQLYCGLNLPPSKDYTCMLIARKNHLSSIASGHNIPEGELTKMLTEVNAECAKLGI